MKVAIADLQAQYAALKGEMDAAVLAVLASGQFGLSEGVTRFEEAAATVCGAKHGIGLNSGTDALLLSLMALDLEPGDEIITTPFTFVATAEVIALLGLKPVFADIDPVTFNLDPAAVIRAITPRTRARWRTCARSLGSPANATCRSSATRPRPSGAHTTAGPCRRGRC
jgi:UDP-2-acetamido-2-deoxy-ribo-hexuluronate aminotransferase